MKIQLREELDAGDNDLKLYALEDQMEVYGYFMLWGKDLTVTAGILFSTEKSAQLAKEYAEQKKQQIAEQKVQQVLADMFDQTKLNNASIHQFRKACDVHVSNKRLQLSLVLTSNEIRAMISP